MIWLFIGAVPISEPYISSGDSRAYFSDVSCDGNETELTNCSHDTLEISDPIENWYSSRRAGVSCETETRGTTCPLNYAVNLKTVHIKQWNTYAHTYPQINHMS